MPCWRRPSRSIPLSRRVAPSGCAAAARDWPIAPTRRGQTKSNWPTPSARSRWSSRSHPRSATSSKALRPACVRTSGGRRPDLLRAARAFETLLQLVPDHYWALIELDPIYRRLQRIDDAERTALQGASLRPNSLRFAARAVGVHMRRRDRGAMQRIATRALAGVPPELDRVRGTLSEDLAYLRTWEARRVARHRRQAARRPTRTL